MGSTADTALSIGVLGQMVRGCMNSCAYEHLSMALGIGDLACLPLTIIVALRPREKLCR